MERMKYKLGFQNCLAVSCEGKSGGIALFWNNRFKVEIQTFSKFHIHAKVTEEEENVESWWLTGFYGNSDVSKRHESWNLLRTLLVPSDKGWLILGDFNEILSNAEKSGGRDKPDRQMKAFTDVIDECHLHDLGFNGTPFTWCNRREMAHCISERLDRFLLNLKWHSFYPMASVIHGVIAYFDHVPIMLKLTAGSVQGPRKKLFRFEAMWVDATDCKQVIQEAWRGVEGRKDLSLADPLSDNRQKLQEARNEVQKWLTRNEIMWKQRSKALWLAEAADEVGSMGFLQGLAGRITPDMVEQMDLPFSEDEVKRALNEMHPTKAPRPDGMSPLFYQKYWSVVGKDVTESILHALNNGYFPSAINHTYVTLIPKRKNPELVSDYRPISLCNVIYKLISKILANRLKLCLPAIISPSQTIFVPGRLITDNVLVAYEMVHFLRRKRKRKDGFMLLKLDMSKAYDRIEWCFLHKVMEQMGFSEKWVKLIMFCVQTDSFSILLNEEPKRPIYPTRGLRQGDPISPYLFLLCTEGLILLLDQANSHNQVEGIRVCRGTPKLNHLLFADDVVLFSRVNMQTCLNLQHQLDIYEKAFSQKVNREKTSMAFSQNVNQPQMDEIMQFWGVHQFQQYDKYLGLPTMVGRGKYQAFSTLKYRVWAKMQGWKEKLLSQGGKEILLKAVALSIPTYTMSCFKLPRSLCSNLEEMMARFWWGQKSDERKICWLSWKKMCDSKLSGGLGFKNLQLFNMALLAKQGWRIMTQESSLLHRIFKARYFPTSSFKDSMLGGTHSFVWRGIWEAKTYLLKGCRWRVGNGLSINIWEDYWLPNHKLVPTPPITATDSASERDNSVASLMMQNPRRWDIEKVRSLIPAREANEVLSIRLSSEDVSDSLVWEHEKSGLYSVNSAYQFFHSMDTDRNRAESSLKLNVDGAIFSDQCRSGIGVVLRDDKGQVTFAASKLEDALADPMEIELIAILRGIQLCIPLGIAELQIESDALLVIEELKKDGRSSTLWSSLIHEIKTLLSSFPAWSIQYRGRESNGVAHNLAKFAWHLDNIALWWDVIPECISQTIWVDSSL
ncbi:uncharacterized protein LOC122293496 [Carya illinoinensis]|uniref:uncharacterized protein LOC122293496 n=1 Tax=Carya illinoinensis TaxID=32201 RepID=UPI001C7264DE|nr:uncharacterized protein LOC122293496 [Carya illinoinensis]